MEAIADSLWVVSNLTVFYIQVAVAAWFVLYLRFRWGDTPAGRDIFWLVMSLMSLVVLAFVGVFANPLSRQSWTEAPAELPLWYAVFRYLVYLGIAVALTRIDASLIRRLRGRQPIMFEIVPRDRPPGR